MTKIFLLSGLLLAVSSSLVLACRNNKVCRVLTNTVLCDLSEEDLAVEN